MSKNDFMESHNVRIMFKDSTGYMAFLTEVHGDEMRVNRSGKYTWYQLFQDGKLIATFDYGAMRIADKRVQKFHDEFAGDWSTFYVDYDFIKRYDF